MKCILLSLILASTTTFAESLSSDNSNFVLLSQMSTSSDNIHFYPSMTCEIEVRCAKLCLDSDLKTFLARMDFSGSPTIFQEGQKLVFNVAKFKDGGFGATMKISSRDGSSLSNVTETIFGPGNHVILVPRSCKK